MKKQLKDLNAIIDGSEISNSTQNLHFQTEGNSKVYFDRHQTMTHIRKADCYHFSATYSVRKQAKPISFMTNPLQSHNTETSGLITLLHVMKVIIAL